jgi:hypothetical protein
LPVVTAVGLVLTLTPLKADIITFDELPLPVPGDGIATPNGYSGLSWSNFVYLDGVNTVFIGSAYPTAVVSPKNIALNGLGAPASLFNPSLISVGSFYITAAWNDGLHVDMQGLRNGTIVYQASVVASTASPMLVHLNWHGVDEVDFQSYGGIPIGVRILCWMI